MRFVRLPVLVDVGGNAGKDLKMTKLSWWKSVTVALGVLLSAATAVAQPPSMRVAIPFAFTAGSRVLPAGEYRVTVDTDFLISRITSGTDEGVLVQLVPGGTPRHPGKLESGMLQFHKYGERYVLSGIWRAGSIAGNEVVGARPPVEFAKAEAVRNIAATR
jgi:hypothetical protein